MITIIRIIMNISRVEVSDQEVKLHFGKTYLTVPRTVFQDVPTVEMID